MYLPDKHFAQYAKDIVTWDPKIVCEPDVCLFRGLTCDDAAVDSNKFFSLTFALFDSKNPAFDVTIPVAHSFYIRNEELVLPAQISR